MTEKFVVIEEIVFENQTPEHLLWLAVLERAILDYVHLPSDLSPIYRHSLHDFFFAEKPRPYNLAYICEILFDREDAAAKIRKRICCTKTAEEFQASIPKSYYRWKAKHKA